MNSAAHTRPLGFGSCCPHVACPIFLLFLLVVCVLGGVSVFGYTRFTLLFYVLCVILLANIVAIGLMLVVGKSMWPWVVAALCAAAVGGIMAFVAYRKLRQWADFPAGVNPLEILFGHDVYYRSGQYEGAGYGATDTPTSAV